MQHTLRLRTCAWAALLVMAPTIVLAQPAEWEARLEALEAEVRALRQENAQLRSDMGLITNRPEQAATAVSVTPAGKEAVLKLNGLVQAQAEFGDRGDSRGAQHDRFRLRRLRLGASGQFLEHFGFKVEGEYGGSSVTLMDGWLNWNRFDAVNLKAGQFKAPFGYEATYSDPRQPVIEPTLGTDRLTLNRQVGLQASGDFLDGRLSYAAGVFNGNGRNNTSNDNENFTYAARVEGILWTGEVAGTAAKLTGGINGFTGNDTGLSVGSDFGFADNRFTGERTGSGVDAQFTAGRFELWAEWLNVRFSPAASLAQPEFDANSWYVQGGYFLLPNIVQVVLRHDEFDPSDARPLDDVDTWTVGTNWFVKGHDLKLQLNYNIVDMPPPTPQQEQVVVRSQVMF